MGRPEVVYPESPLLSHRQWRHCQLLADHFWRHFIQRYLLTLQKWNTERANLQLGLTVIIVDHQLPHALWPIGKYFQIIPGLDTQPWTTEGLWK